MLQLVAPSSHIVLSVETVLRTRAHWKATESCSEHFTDDGFEAESAQFGIKRRKKLEAEVWSIPTIFVRQTFRNETAMLSCRKRGPESHGIEREPKRSAVEKRERRQVSTSCSKSYPRSWPWPCKRLLRQQPLLI